MTAIAAGAHVPAAPPRDDKADAARQLEAFFLRRLLSEARPASGSDPLVGGGFAGETFKEMLDDQLADKMAEAGGVGLAGIIGKQLGADPAALAGRAPAASSIEDLERRISRVPVAGAAAPAIQAASASPSANASAPAIDGIVPGVDPSTTSADGFCIPIGAARRTSGYGMRIDPIDKTRSLHPGLDLAAPTGTPVAAAAAGTVVRAGNAGTYGNLVTIRHDNGLETRYAHLSAITVKKGQHVEAGAEIGAVGTTGHSTGPHLHFEVRDEGKPLDPVGFLPPLDHLRSRPNR